MSDKINVEAILKKHSNNVSKQDGKLNGRENLTVNEAKAAIKEIVEAVIDKCAENASLNGRRYNAKTRELKDITEEIGGGCYWEGHPEDQPLPDLEIEINKQSILNIKKEIEYE